VVFASANLFWGALFHLVMTPILDRYSPDLFTSMLLYYPICILVAVVITKDKILAPRPFVLTLLGKHALRQHHRRQLVSRASASVLPLLRRGRQPQHPDGPVGPPGRCVHRSS
jgi:hypothetical protein